MISFKLPTNLLAIAICTATLCLSNPVTAWAAAVVGTSSAVKGKVFVSTKGAERKAKVQQSIKLNDKIRTREDSALQILLLDESIFTVGQNCEMIIDRFVYDPSTSAGQMSAKVVKGAFRFMSGGIGKNDPANASISTPSATIGIRGTIFEGIVGEDAVLLAELAGLDLSNVDPLSASFIILRGPGRTGNTLDLNGEITVTTGGGQAVISQPNFAVFTPAPGLPPVGPIKVPARLQALLDLFLRTPPNGPSENPTNEGETGSSFSRQDRFEGFSDALEDLLNDIRDGITDPTIQNDPPQQQQPLPPDNDSSGSTTITGGGASD